MRETRLPLGGVRPYDFENQNHSLTDLSKSSDIQSNALADSNVISSLVLPVSGQIIQIEIPKTTVDENRFSKGQLVYIRPSKTRIFE